jgi:LmbE family N-acetylglucosaminyl deacetylase
MERWVPLNGDLIVLTGRSRAACFREEAPGATIITDPALLDGMEARFDAAIVDGLLDDELWDRWLLQRLHRTLREEAPIVLVVRPLLTLASATDLRFLWYACRQGARKLAQRCGLAFELHNPVRRRYHLAWLVRKLESAGYTAVMAGPGWPDSAETAGRPWLARRAIVTARKAPCVPGIDGRRWPDAEVHRRRFAAQHAALASAREKWIASFPEFRELAPRAMEPCEWRDAHVLVLAPHPDDELIGCGGTLCRMRSAGARVSIVQATDGCGLESLRDLPDARRRTVRLEEAERVAAALGAELRLWRERDTGLRCNPSTAARLARLLEEARPTHVFTPFLGDLHADHRTLSCILGEALAIASVAPQILQYEVWSLVPANRYCDITGQQQTLERLLFFYERAMRVEDFASFCRSRNLARAVELTGKPAYVEAFLCTTSAEYRALMGRSAWEKAA